MAQALDHQFHRAVSTNEMSTLLQLYPSASVLWDSEDPSLRKGAIQSIAKAKPNPNRLILISEHTPDKFMSEDIPFVFGHLWTRRYDGPAAFIYQSVLRSLRMTQRFGLKRFFHEGDYYQKLQLKRSTHKTAAVLATQKVLSEHHCTPRIASLVAQAVDELILNALFEAPVLPSGTHHKKALDPASDFELTPQEWVEVEYAVATDYFAISIVDQFGSLPIDRVRKLVLGDGKVEKVTGSQMANEHLGFNGISRAGLSILVNCLVGERTEVTLFIPRGTNMREFRAGLRFASVMIS